jgi:hypothetical protein
VADVIVIFVAFVLTLAAATITGFLIVTARRRQALAKKFEGDYLDSYVRRLDQAVTDEDLNRLEKERKSRGWDGLFLPLSCGWRRSWPLSTR